MADIKTREVNKGSIKSIDRAANLSGHVRSATVRTKESVERNISRDERSETAYASDKSIQMAEDAARSTGRAIQGGSRKAQRAVSTKRDMVDIKTRRKMINRAARSSAAGSENAIKSGRQEAAKVSNATREKRIRTAERTAVVKSVQQAKKVENATTDAKSPAKTAR